MSHADPRAMPRHGELHTYVGRSEVTCSLPSWWLVFSWRLVLVAIFAPGADAATNASVLMPGELMPGTDRATPWNFANVTRASAETCSALGRFNRGAHERALISELDTSTTGSSSPLGSFPDGWCVNLDTWRQPVTRLQHVPWHLDDRRHPEVWPTHPEVWPIFCRPSTAVALLSDVRLLSAEEMMPRHMRGVWSRALQSVPLPRAPNVRCAPPTLVCILYYCALIAVAAWYVLTAPNDKAMRSRLRLALVLLIVGLPVATALQDPAHEKSGDDETSFDAPAPPLANATISSRMTRRLALSKVCINPVDTWEPDWGASPSVACESWATNEEWGARVNGQNLMDSCEQDWARQHCLATCCRLLRAPSLAKAPPPPPPRAPDARRSERLWSGVRADVVAVAPLAAHVGKDLEVESRLARRGAVLTIVQPGEGTLQAALASAAAGDELVLEDGNYTGDGGEPYSEDTMLILQINITIRAQNAGRAILDGEATRRVVFINGTANVVLDGLVITRGYADVRHRAFPHNDCRLP